MCLLIFSYVIGKTCLNVNFDVRQYTFEQLRIPMIQAVLALFAKVMAYAGFYMIPLTIASCVYFTVAPIFAALLGFMCICEMLTCREVITIALSLIGTFMVTMPQWFLPLGLDTGESAQKINERLDQDIKKYGGELTYYLGILLVAASVFIDCSTNFAVRFMGATTDVPKSFIPFMQGAFNSCAAIVYISVFEAHQHR